MGFSSCFSDTEHIYEEITERIAAAFNIKYPLDVRMKVKGRTEHDSAVVAVRELKLPIGVPEYLKKYEQMSRAMLGGAPLLKGRSSRESMPLVHSRDCVACSKAKEEKPPQYPPKTLLFLSSLNRVCFYLQELSG